MQMINNSFRFSSFECLSFLFLTICYISLAFIPLLSYALSITFIFFCRDNRLRFALYPPLVISFVLIVVSRELFLTYKDDFVTYYEMYMSQSQYGFLNYFGFEIGLSFLNYIIFNVFGELQPRILLLIYVFLQLVFIVLLLELMLARSDAKFDFNKLVSFIFMFMPFLAFSLTIRQNFSIIIMLFCFTFRSKYIVFALLIIASAFHLSALPIFLLIIFFRWLSLKRWWDVFLFVSVVFLLVFYCAQYLSEIPKIRAFFQFDLKFNFFVFSEYYKLLISIFLLSLVLNGEVSSRIKKMIFLVLIVALSFDLLIPYVSFRVFQIFIVFVGFVFFLVYGLLRSALNKFVYSIFIFFMFYVKLFTTIDSNSDFAVFKAYNYFEISPFYYIDVFLEDVRIVDREKI